MIAYKALPSALVEKIEIDVSEMKPGDTVKVGDLPIAVAQDVDLITNRDAIVVLVSEPHAAAEDISSDTPSDTASE